jgi:uncharacterized repeat protein (TIGR03943 family)
MTVRPVPRPAPRRSHFPLQLWLDVLAIATWGILLLSYRLTGKLNLLLHPNYIWLPVCAGVFLLALALWKAGQGLRMTAGQRLRPIPNPQHFTLFPPGWSSVLLLSVAIFGLQFTPQPFSSSMAIDRGVTEMLTMTRSQPQAFRGSIRPEQRSIVDWLRTLSVYPEPDAYLGQKVNVQGFVIQPSTLPDNYLVIARFIITCCAADVYPAGLTVKLSGSRSAYPADTWLQIVGDMSTETIGNQRQLVIQARSLQTIPQPKNPYDY